MIHRPHELGQYCWHYLIYVECKECHEDACIGSIDDTGEPILKCDHCGWLQTLTGKTYEDLIAEIKRSIAGVGDT